MALGQEYHNAYQRADEMPGNVQHQSEFKPVNWDSSITRSSFLQVWQTLVPASPRHRA